MAFSVVQAGSDLYFVSDAGVVTPLTLPSNITLSDQVPPRWAVMDRYVMLVNSPDQPLTIDGTGIVRVLTPLPPSSGPIVSSGSAGSLSGTYGGLRYTFVTQDPFGNTIAESDYSPESNTVTIASANLQVDNVQASEDDITLRRIYRPTTDGSELFQWIDIDGNVITTAEDDLSDAGLSLVAGPILGTPPHLTLIAEFRNRLFGVGSEEPDTLRYTETGLRYAWPSTNGFIVPPSGADVRGVTALVPRRDALGLGRSNLLAQITGTGKEDSEGNVDLDIVVLSRELGIESQESAAVWRDIAYFLWKDGVYEWGPDGIRCISDGANGVGNVRSWFATDDYFNRSRFQYAFGTVDPKRLKYRLHLATPDSEVENRWVEFDLKDRTWWGPHKTGLFTPTSTFVLNSAQNTEEPVIGGSNGSLYEEQTTRTDGPSTAIDFDVIGKRHDAGEPDVDKYWGQISLFNAPNETGLLSVQAIAGELDGAVINQQYHDLSLTRENMGRLGTGKHCQLRMQHATAGEQLMLFGYECVDVHVIGRR